MKGQSSFEEYVGARAHALTRTAYLLTGDHHEAQDLVQGALLKAVGVWSRIEDDPEPYVRRIIYHDSVSRWRRRRHREALVDRLPDRPAPEGDPALRLTLADALDRLTPKQRAVLVLRFYEDLTEAQTAAVLGVGLGTVKSQTRHALGRLRVLAPHLADLVSAE